MNEDKNVSSEESKLVVPIIKLECPNCKTEFSIDALHRLYRAHLALTRFSRALSYQAVCCNCGKHTQVRIPPLHPLRYLCRKCQIKADQEKMIGYKKNPIANKTYLRE